VDDLDQRIEPLPPRAISGPQSTAIPVGCSRFVEMTKFIELPSDSLAATFADRGAIRQARE
jgi:hypothetical protein